MSGHRHGRLDGWGARAAVLALGAATLVPAPAGAQQSPPVGQRLLIGVGVLPQLQQYIEQTAFPAEVYTAEILIPSARRWYVGAGVTGRTDFMLVGVSTNRSLYRSTSREWRVSAGLEYAVLFGEADVLYEQLKARGASTSDRLAFRLGISQTFQMDKGRLAVRVAYDARFVKPGSVLSVLEGLDDAIGDSETFLLHQITAGLDVRLGG